MSFNARMICYGGWGVPTPRAFAYELTRGATYRQLKRSRRDIDDAEVKTYNAIRLGKKPGTEKDDTRPTVPAFYLPQNEGDVLNVVSAWAPERSGILSQIGYYTNNYGLSVALGEGGGVRNILPSRSAWIPANGAFGVQAFVYGFNESSSLAQSWGFWWGTPGNGYIFVLQDGRPHVGRLSLQWNRAEQETLMDIWAASDSETDIHEQLRQTLQAKLFEDFEQLSLERTVGRDKDSWVKQEFTLVFIPEPRGILHVMLYGGDVVAHEWKAQLKKRADGVLWGQSKLTFFARDIAFDFRVKKVYWARSARLLYGPFPHGPWANELDQIVYDQQVSAVEGHSSLSFTRIPDTDISSYFGATITTDGTAPVWVYGLNARIPPGPRTGDTTVAFDTTDLYVPANPNALRETGNPIMDIRPSWDGQGRGRQCTVIMRDVKGTVSATFGTNETSQSDIDGAIGRVTKLYMNGSDYMEGIVWSATHNNMGQMTENVAPIFNARSDSQLQFQVMDGVHILSEMNADCSVIGDNRHPGAMIRDLLRQGGYGSVDWVNVPVNAGRLITKAGSGEDWACITERGAKIWDCIQRILDQYCLGYVFYQDFSGNWVLEKPSTMVRGQFSSLASNNNPNTTQGRRTIMEELDWIRDPSGFYNHFRVVGGDDGNEIVQEWTIEESIHNKTSKTYIGYKKSYPEVRNPGLRTKDDVQYALRCLVKRWGKPGRRYQHPTYFDPYVLIGYRYEHDGRLVELEGISSASMAEDRMLTVLREVV